MRGSGDTGCLRCHFLTSLKIFSPNLLCNSLNVLAAKEGVDVDTASASVRFTMLEDGARGLEDW